MRRSKHSSLQGAASFKCLFLRHSNTQQGLQSRVWRKGGEKESLEDSTHFSYKKYWVEFQRVGKSPGQQRRSKNAHFSLFLNQRLLASGGTSGQFSPESPFDKLHPCWDNHHPRDSHAYRGAPHLLPLVNTTPASAIQWKFLPRRQCP